MIEIPNPMPKKMTVDVFLYHRTSEYIGQRLDVSLREEQSGGGYQYVFLAKAKVTFKIEDIDIVGCQVDALKRQKQMVLETAQEQVSHIDQQIQSLLAIEHKPEVEA